MGMPFTDKEKEQIKWYLGYPDWSQMAQSIQLGIPQGSQPLFLVQSAFETITPDARDSVRRCLCELDDIHCQLRSGRQRLKVAQVGDVKMNPDELPKLKVEMMYWTTKLADTLGVLPDPYSQLMYRAIDDIGGRNARVTQ